MNKEFVLNLKNRQIVYKAIQGNPGINITNLIKKTNIPKSTLNYHIRYLLKTDLIICKKNVRSVRFFVRNKISNSDKELLAILRNNIRRKIIIYVLFTAASSRLKISQALEKDPTTVSHHIKKLLDEGILESAPYNGSGITRSKGGLLLIKPIGREVYYRLENIKKHKIYNLFITHQDSLLTTEEKNIIDFFNNIVNEGVRKIDNDIHTKADRMMNVFNELFPLPFCA